MTVGIAFSGGDYIAALGSMCQTSWLAGAFPTKANGGDVIVSTVSGGTMGYGVMANNGQNIYVPPYNPALTLEEATGALRGPNGQTWVGAGAFIHGKPDPVGADGRRRAQDDAAAIRNGFDEGSKGGMGAHLWRSVIDAFYMIYRVNPKDIAQGPVPWFANFAKVNKRFGQLPLKPDSIGVIEQPMGKVEMGISDMANPAPFSADAVVSFSSAFWAMDPLTSTKSASKPLQFQLKKFLLPQDKNYYFSDGGTVDMSGITTLLNKKANSVIAFFNEHRPIEEVSWMIGTLFGTNKGRELEHPPSDSNIGGAQNTQVFPVEYAEQVIANLTNPNIMRAVLRNVPVLGNKWLNIQPYTLDTLIIFSSMKNKEFLGSFKDQRLAQQIGKKWPVQYDFGMPKLDVNMFCMLQHWNMNRYRDELKEAMYF